MSSVKRFFIQLSHFFIGNSFSVILGFITFPILTRVLSREDYGILGLVTTTSLIIVAVSKAGLSNGIVRFYEEHNDGNGKLEIFSSTVIVRGILMSLITVSLYLIALPVVYKLVGIQKGYLICFLLIAGYIFFRPLDIIVCNFLMVTGKTLFLNIVHSIGRVASIALSLSLLVYVINELYGYFIGYVAAEIGVSILLLHWFFKTYRVNFKKTSNKLMFDLLKFGTPLMFFELSFLLLTYSDRYLILGFYGRDELGLYSVGYNLAMYIADIITFSLAQSVIPVYVKIFTNQGLKATEEFLSKALRYVLVGLIPVCFGYYAIADELFEVLASNKYIAAAAFSPIILLGSLLLSLSNIFNAGLYINKKAWTMLFINLVAVILNILLNLILLPKYGVMGAAISTLLACIALILLTMFTSFKYISIKLNIRSFLLNLALSILMVYLLGFVKVEVFWQALVIKIILGALIISTGVLFLERELYSKLKQLLI